MKIIEAQSAILTNFEVYQHLVDQESRYKRDKRRAPANLATLVRELLQYMHTPPSPLSQKPLTYTASCITELLSRLRPYDLSKGEVVMILNLRPASVAALNTIIEDMGERFSDDQQAEMIDIIAQVLGQFESPAEQEAQGDVNGDVSMNETAVS